MKKGFLLYSTVICMALFTVPFLFPQKNVVQSLSYEMGFNNSVGMILLVVASLLIFCYGIIKAKHAEAIIVFDKEEYGSKKILHILQIASFSILFILGLLFWGVEEGVLQAYWPIHYSDAMKYGWVLYEDLHVIYGKLQILPLHWLRLIGIPAMSAQLLLVAVSSVLCLYCVYEILGVFQIPVKDKNAILILAAILFFPYYMGIEGFRYVYTTWIFLKLISLSERKSIFIVQAVSVVASVLFSLLFSQEYGLCLSVVLILYYSVESWINKSWHGVVLSGVTIVSLLMVIWLQPGMFKAVLYMAGGASSFPYIPCIHLIVFFMAVLLFAWMMGTQFKEFKENYKELMLELLLVSYLPSVLGRCNPPHVLQISFFLLIISGILLVKRYNKKVVMVIAVLTFLTPFPFIIKTQGLSIIRPALSNVVKHNQWAVDYYIEKQLPGYQSIVNKQEKSKERKANREDFLSIITPTTSVMSFCSDEYLYVYLNEHGKYVENFFGQSLSWLANEEQFKEVIDRIDREKPYYIVLPKDYKQSWMNYSERGIINLWFCTYSTTKPYRSYNSHLYGPLIDYIENHYIMLSSFEGFELYNRK